ncbi:MAG: T9SS type A sorting domain-containing protein [Bacteroidetes bacterium]|nr:T9SS type A sorting domain-containing protein [Bacteroidota bacterium]
MKKILFIFFIFQTSFQFADAQWIKQFSPNHDLSDIEFINRNTGWTCGENYIYKTTDGGISWNEQSHPDAFLIQQIFPVNENVVYAVGWWNFMKTTNGGENWIAFFNGSTGQGLPVLEGLHFINENTGWLVGNVVAMKTTNGGISFIDSMRVGALAQDVYFKDSLNGIMCGENAGFYKTINGGQNWIRIPVIQNGPLYSFYRLTIFNDSLVWLASKSVYRSTNFGNSWDSLGLIPMEVPNRSIYCMKFPTPTIGFAGGQSLELYKTIDGGYNWIPQQTSQYTPGLYLGIYAYNDSIIWASGRRIILNTTTGGLVGIRDVSNNNLKKDFILFQNYPNPFNPNTIIKYSINLTSLVRINIYDILGNKISTIVKENKLAGSYEITFNGSDLSNGVYFYTLEINDILIDSKKLLLLK